MSDSEGEFIPRFEVIRVMIEMVDTISSVRIYMPQNVRNPAIKVKIYDMLLRAKKNFDMGFPTVSAKDMGLTDPEKVGSEEDAAYCKKLDGRIKSLEKRLLTAPAFAIPDDERKKLCNGWKEAQKLKNQVVELNKKQKQSHLMLFRQELKNRLRVLRRLGHISPDGVLLEKGKIAAEIEGIDGLVMGELIFEGIFAKEPIAVGMALITCFFQMPKSKEQTNLTPPLAKAFKKLKAAAMKVCAIQVECKIPIEEEEYLESFNPKIMQLTHAWISKKSFPEICKLSDEFEGNIVRNLRRLEELLRQMIDASKSIGNADLEAKFEEGSKLLKRGIVFANSLYV